MTRYLFVTGFVRSGTTYLEKLLHNIPGNCISPQPFPMLFINTKRRFLVERGLSPGKYPLGHLLSERYDESQWLGWLEKSVISVAELSEIAMTIERYSGSQTLNLATAARNSDSGYFIDVYRNLARVSADLLGRSGASVIGSKEVFCEEYISYLLQKDCHAILVIRNPLRVCNSIWNSQDTDNQMDIMHIARSWRKSVAIHISASDNPRYAGMRQEDLALDPGAQLARAGRKIGLNFDTGNLLEKPLLDQYGAEWKINTAFEGEQQVSLDQRDQKFIEALCFPELVYMRYPTQHVQSIEDARREIEERMEPGLEKELETGRLEQLDANGKLGKDLFIRNGVRAALISAIKGVGFFNEEPGDE